MCGPPAYGSGNNGQIQTIDDVTTGSANAATSLTYTYDAWLRLKTAQTNNLTSSNTWKLDWGYDRLGNRLSQTQTGGMATNIVQPNLTVSETTNRITTTGYTYDTSGNMINDSIHAYTYDAENRITSMDSAGTYLYDGNGLRIKKGTTTYIYSGTKVIAEYTSSGLQKEYVYSGSQLLATLNSSGTPTYSHPDHLSTRVETNSSGTVTRTYGHYPFGDTWYETGSNKLAFTSYERDSDSGLDYAVMRYNSPRLGRFATADLLAGSTLNPQTLNRYSYVRNDPINLIDPIGLFEICSGRWVGGGVNEGGHFSDCFDFVFPDPIPFKNPDEHGGGGSREKAKQIIKKALSYKKLSECLHKFFGPGTILTNANLPRINATEDLKGAAVGQTRPEEVPDQGRPTIRIDKGTFNGMSGDSTLLADTYLHETANALALQRFTKLKGENRVWRPFLGPLGKAPTKEQNEDFDPDIGQQFEKCLKGK